MFQLSISDAVTALRKTDGSEVRYDLVSVVEIWMAQDADI